MLICIPRQARGPLHRAVTAHPPSKPSRCVSAECAVLYLARCPLWIIRESLSENIRRQDRSTYPVTLPIFSLGVLCSDDEEVNPSLDFSSDLGSITPSCLGQTHLRLLLIWGLCFTWLSPISNSLLQALFFYFPLIPCHFCFILLWNSISICSSAASI